MLLPSLLPLPPPPPPPLLPPSLILSLPTIAPPLSPSHHQEPPLNPTNPLHLDNLAAINAMAYSPSPRPAAAGSSTQIRRHSATPPFPQVISKQKKRRNQLADRLNDISVSFAQNRDENYRKQLQSLQFDMNYIHRAQPYENFPLDDLGSDIIDGMNATTSNVNDNRSSVAGTRISDVDAPARAGIWSSKFSLEVNDAMEERDTQLTLVAV